MCNLKYYIYFAITLTYHVVGEAEAEPLTYALKFTAFPEMATLVVISDELPISADIIEPVRILPPTNVAKIVPARELLALCTV